MLYIPTTLLKQIKAAANSPLPIEEIESIIVENIVSNFLESKQEGDIQDYVDMISWQQIY